MRLFSEKLVLGLPDSNITYYPSFLTKEEANTYFKTLLKNVPWQEDKIKVFGKWYNQPRLTALYGNNRKTYSYSGITMYPHDFTTELLKLKSAIEDKAQTQFTTCLLNYYRDGKDSNGWHADNEKELGMNPVIASLSLGAERLFHLRHQQNKELRHKLLLEHGSLLLMKGKTQHFWHHHIPKTAKPVGGRINLTFRLIH